MDVPRLHVASAATFDETAADVWARIGDFGDVRWMPGVEQVEHLEHGSVRKVHLQGGGPPVSEQLVASTARSMTFRFSDPGALPVAHYLATLRVHDEGDGSLVTWSAEFAADGAEDETARAQMTAWYEACLSNAGGTILSPLSLHVFVSDYKPISAPVAEWSSADPATWPASTATLIAGVTDAVLIDALITATEVDELVAWIAATGKNLTTVYVTHGHADHFLGLAAVLAAFPGATAVALPEVVPFADEQLTDAYLAYWGALFPGQLPETVAGPRPLPSPSIDLEGHQLVPISVGQSDTDPSSVVYVRDLDTVAGGDVVYNNIHPWLAQTGPTQREEWEAAIDMVDELEASWVVAGHRDPHAPSDAAGPLIAATRRYLADFSAAAAESTSGDALIRAMLQRHPDLGNPYTLTASAVAQFPGAVDADDVER
ncbi:glyoxylase-like metal-dependent hydrolase (beta-lactamase superfamily II)/carbon monoxide dehydrogenase subunit G [Curtobacterium sp. PvP017]|uniref:SRPBCC family protein n=1 Tax=Curtobacterium citreum TaxID=2036 RepID=A0ABU8Y5E8_9MICO|nr:SRPBCC family protein [Curtobacterium sp. JUb34]ROR35925.1 glyoxylase-like metal-dependent hydrolase (beta-lactamase superfamily II) [Curtobacterium sp. JUb34]